MMLRSILFAVAFVVLLGSIVASQWRRPAILDLQVPPITQAAPAKVVIKPAPPEVRTQIIKKKRVVHERVLQRSCTTVRWAKATFSESAIRKMESLDSARRGLTAAQRRQQEREAKACLR